jgi:hypothetical protein
VEIVNIIEINWQQEFFPVLSMRINFVPQFFVSAFTAFTFYDLCVFIQKLH